MHLAREWSVMALNTNPSHNFQYESRVPLHLSRQEFLHTHTHTHTLFQVPATSLTLVSRFFSVALRRLREMWSLSVCLYVCLSLSLSLSRARARALSLSVCPSVRLSVSLSLSFFLSLSLCVYVSRYLSVRAGMMEMKKVICNSLQAGLRLIV